MPFASVFLAEFGDKSQFALFLLSAKTKKHARLLLGAFLAFLFVDGAAVLAGDYVLNIIPLQIVRTAAGMIFIALGLFYLLKNQRQKKEELRLASPLYSGFAVVFFSEWGDKTQVAAALFATQFSPLLVLAGVLSSLFLISCLAVYAGRFVHKRINTGLMNRISGVIFLVIGLVFVMNI